MKRMVNSHSRCSDIMNPPENHLFLRLHISASVANISLRSFSLGSLLLLPKLGRMLLLQVPKVPCISGLQLLVYWVNSTKLEHFYFLHQHMPSTVPATCEYSVRVGRGGGEGRPLLKF